MFERTKYMTDAEKAEMRDEIIKATPFPVEPKEVIVKVPKRSKTTMDVQKVFDGLPRDWHGNDKGKALARLFEVFLGEPLVLPAVKKRPTNMFKKKDSKSLQALVPIRTGNSHTYPIGEVCLILKNYTDVCMRGDGSNGNHVDEQNFRYATLQEIDAFLDKLQKKVQVYDIVRHF
jgi:hypothetical protein